MKKKSTIYEHLAPVLENGTEEDVALARKKYWQAYRAQWKKDKRTEHTTIEISCTKQEINVIDLEAKRHKRSRAKYCKDAVLSYANQTFLVPEQTAYNSIKELLTLLYNRIKDYEDEEKLSPGAITIIIEQFNSIEDGIKKALEFPSSIS